MSKQRHTSSTANHKKGLNNTKYGEKNNSTLNYGNWCEKVTDLIINSHKTFGDCADSIRLMKMQVFPMPSAPPKYVSSELRLQTVGPVTVNRNALTTSGAETRRSPRLAGRATDEATATATASSNTEDETLDNERTPNSNTTTNPTNEGNRTVDTFYEAKLQLFKSQLDSLQRYADTYSVSCSKACEILLSNKFLSNDQIQEIREHPLYTFVESGLSPSSRLCRLYKLTPMEYFSKAAFVMEDAESVDELDPPDDSSDSASVKTHHTITNIHNEALVQPARAVKNIVLLFKIIRAVVLNLEDNSSEFADSMLAASWQGAKPFSRWVLEFKEAVEVAKSIGRNFTEEEITSRFLNRVNQEELRTPLHGIYSATVLPSFSRCVQIFQSYLKRQRIRDDIFHITTGLSGTPEQLLKGDQSVAFVSSSLNKKKERSRPCKHCNGEHWDNECPKQHSQGSRKPVKTRNRPCKHCQGDHWDSECSLSTDSVSSSTTKVQKSTAHLGKTLDQLAEKMSKEDMAELLHSQIERLGFMTTTKSGSVPQHIYFDNCAQDIILKDKDLLSNAKSCSTSITVSGISDSNGASDVSSEACGSFYGFPAFYCPNATANLISMGFLKSCGCSFEYIDNGNGSIVRDINKVHIFTTQFIDNMNVMVYINKEYLRNKTYTAAKSTDKIQVIKTRLSLMSSVKAKRREEEVFKLHRQLNYPTPVHLAKMINNGIITGTHIQAADVNYFAEKLISMSPRRIANMVQQTTKESDSSLATIPGQAVYADLIYDAMNNRYFFTIDRMSKLMTLQMLNSSKGTDQIISAISNVDITYNKYNYKVKKLITDAEPVLKANEVLQYFHGRKTAVGKPDPIIINRTIPGESNKICERAVRTLSEEVAVLLAALPYELPDILYPSAHTAAVMLLNKKTTTALSDTQTAYSIFTQKKLNVSNEHVEAFGTIAVLFRPESLRTKTHPDRTDIGIILYDSEENQSCFWVYIPSSDQYVERSKRNYRVLPTPPSQWQYKPNRRYLIKSQLEEYNNNNSICIMPINSYTDTDTMTMQLKQQSNTITEDNIPQDNSDSNQVNPEIHERLILKIPKERIKAYITTEDECVIQKNPKNEAIFKELKQMKDLNVFTTINYHDIPVDERKGILESLLFIKHKFKANGEFDKIKARLVARGDQQDTNEIYSSPTAHLLSLFTLLSIAAKYCYFISTIDVPGAYLHATIDADIYMQLPQTCTSIWNSINGTHTHSQSTYVKLNKAIYGLKQSSKLWYITISSFLESIGLKRTNKDPCTFSGKISDQLIFILIYVDDLFLTSPSMESIQEIKSHLDKKFGTVTFQDKGSISYLGIEMTQSIDRSSISINQNAFIFNFISNFEKQIKDKISTSNYPSNENLWSTCNDNNSFNTKLFVSSVMSLLYVAIRTRFDIMKEISFLATRLTSSNVTDFNKLLKVIGYLKLHPKKFVTFATSDCTQLQLYADASYRVHDDTSGQSGIVIRLFGNTIFVRSIKQKVVVKSSTEAELVALDEGFTYCIYVSYLLQELGISYSVPFTIFQDNMSTMFLAKNGVSNFKRSKHIASKYFYIKQFLDSNVAILKYCNTDEMLADILTKPLVGYKFKKFLDRIFNSN